MFNVQKSKQMNEIQVFKNEQFGQIRTLEVDNEPWFVGNDVARALGYGEGKSLPNAVNNHVDKEDKGVTEMMTPGGKQQVIIINESGVYALIFGSKLPTAKEFKHWVTSEVLPQIRKTGSYGSPFGGGSFTVTPTMKPWERVKVATRFIINECNAMYDYIDQMQGALKLHHERQLAYASDADYTRKVLTSKDTWNTNVIAKEFGMSAVTLNKHLHRLGIQYKQHGVWVLTHEYQDKGYTKTQTYTYPTSEGETCTRLQMEWTEKGRRWLHELYDAGKFSMNL